jgi:hypothetical protein
LKLTTWIVTIERFHPDAAQATRLVLEGVTEIPVDAVDEVLRAGGGAVRILSLDQANTVMLKLYEVGVPSHKELETPPPSPPEPLVVDEPGLPTVADEMPPTRVASQAPKFIVPSLGAAGVLLIAVLSVCALNHFRLQWPMTAVVRGDPRNAGVDVSVRYGYYVDPTVLVYDLRDIRSTNSMVDVFRVFLQFAEQLRHRQFEVVELSFHGTVKFKLSGEYFRELGRGYGTQNPMYTMRTFPEHLLTAGGSRAYSSWSGGWLGVTLKQIEDFNDFHARWYLRDIVGAEPSR